LWPTHHPRTPSTTGRGRRTNFAVSLHKRAQVTRVYYLVVFSSVYYLVLCGFTITRSPAYNRRALQRYAITRSRPNSVEKWADKGDRVLENLLHKQKKGPFSSESSKTRQSRNHGLSFSPHWCMLYAFWSIAGLHPPNVGTF
jgi:hypothetical protein